MAAHNYVRKYVRGPLWATLVAALVAAAGSLLVFGQSGEAAQGAKVRTYDPKIIGQTPVPDGKYPFMASLHRGDPGAASDNLNGSFFCGGTYIKQGPDGTPTGGYVLTAAHCLNPHKNAQGQVFWKPQKDPNTGVYNFSISLGRTDHTHEPKNPSPWPVTWFKQHPSYKPGVPGPTHDVAVIQIQPRAVATTIKEPGSIVEPRSHETPKTISIAGPAFNFLEDPGDRATLAGWGRLASGSKPQRLQEVTMPIVSDADADKAYAYYQPAIQLAAGEYGKGPCPGDSGGPLFAVHANTTYQIGITSYGFPHAWSTAKCSGTGKAEVYTEVNSPDIYNFIAPIIGAPQ